MAVPFEIPDWLLPEPSSSPPPPPVDDQTPVATLVAPQTVRLSLGNVAGFSLREDHWRDLKVIYDYRPPMRRDPDRP